MKIRRLVLQLFSFVAVLVCCPSARCYEPDSSNSEPFKWFFSEEPANRTYERKPINEPPLAFRESWSYVMIGRENELKASFPITDIGYFSAEVNAYGELVGIPKRSKLSFFKGRVHLVATCSGRALTHFVISEDSPCRRPLIRQLLAASKDFDGLQIDFESIPGRDIKAFHSFLRELRDGLPKDKIFSVAVQARSKSIADDAFNYAVIEPLADRIFIMAYDQHWGGSSPGPIAAADWGKRIADYAMTKIPLRKLVMGVPFYGRSWADKSPAGAWYFSRATRIYNENEVSDIQRTGGVPFYTHSTTVNVTTYFEDDYSVYQKCKQYRDMGIRNIGFWRVGQEDPEFWKNLVISKN